jgi:hypothetical protein
VYQTLFLGKKAKDKKNENRKRTTTFLGNKVSDVSAARVSLSLGGE